jgi:hypothetical protein
MTDYQAACRHLLWLRDALGAQHAYAPDYRGQTVLTSPASPNSDLPTTIND